MTALQTTPTGADARTSGTAPLVVLGPLTRVGRDLVSRRGGPVLAVSRSGSDTTALRAQGLTTTDVAGDGLAELVAGAPTLDVAICALGPVHPGPVDVAADRAGIERDLGFLRHLLQVAGDRPVRLVLVSSVVALAPGADRRYYGGSKALVEQALVALLAEHPRARLDVLYPGRLLSRAEHTRPWHRLHAGFSRVATHVERALRADRADGRRRVVGLDARLWLLVRSLSLVVSGIRPGRVVPSLELPPDTEVTS